MASLLATGLCLRAAPPARPRSCVGMKQATAKKPKATGFGVKAKPQKRVPVVPLDPSLQMKIDALAQGEQSIQAYLNPQLFEDPATMADVSKRLKAGEVVVLKDAFRPEFAEMVHAELSSKDVAWELNEAYFPDGYHHRHHNVYDQASWSARLNASLAMLSSAASQRFMQELTGRDCSGETQGAPSWYKTGDHSLPHTDWVALRTVDP